MWCLGVLLLAAAVSGVTVEIPSVGSVEGVTYPIKGLSIDAFLGIPYAAPPVGDLRWQPPAAGKSWTGVRPAKTYGAACYGARCSNVAESEDCLFLNIFRRTNSTTLSFLLPVMVWIHGGAYEAGCSNAFAADALIATEQSEDIVVVTLNYRLNVFGFLGSDALRASDGSTGNFGIQDQRMALEWVSKHIAAFGGDPRHVTIFGESAGAGSVAAHMVMPKSFGLYRSAVAESGAGAIWNGKSLAKAEMVASIFSADTKCSTRECLLKVSGAKLWDIASRIPPSTVNITWCPVVDGVELKAEPWQLLKAGEHVKNVDIMLGTNRDEGAFFFIERNSPPANSTEGDYDTAVLRVVPQANLSTVKALYQPAKYSYPSNLGNYSFWWWAAMRGSSDRSFTCPNRRTLRWLTTQGNPNTFAYFFIHPTSSTIPKVPGTGPGAVTVPHASEIPYVFGCANMTREGELPGNCTFASEAEENLSVIMSKAWVRFAVYQNPNGPSVPKWKPYTQEEDNYMVFDVTQRAGGEGLHDYTNLRTTQCDFWDASLPQMPNVA